MKNVLLMSAFVVTLASCSSSDSDNPAITPLKVDRIVEGGATTTFNYTGDNLTSAVTTQSGQDTKRRDFTYSAGLLTDIHTTYTNPTTSAVTSESNNHYSYTSGRVIANVENYVGGDTYTSQYTYTGETLTSKVEHDQNSNLTGSDTYEFFVNDNLKKLNSSGFITNYTSYDTFKTVESLLYPEAILKARAISENNLLQDDRGHTYEYEYNADGYPTKIISKNGGIVTSTQFIYYQ